jgi:PAS domain S-box-containing protein
MRLETLGLLVAIAAAIAVAAIGFTTTDALTETSREVDRAHTTIEALDRVLVAVGSAGSARRAYLLGKDEGDVAKFDVASADARDALAEARTLVVSSGGATEPFDRMDALLGERLGSLRASVERRRAGGLPDAEPPTRSELDLMESLRTAIFSTTNGLHRLLRDHEARAVRMGSVARGVDLTGTALCVVVLGLAFTKVRSEAAREREARAVTDRANRFLDSVVENLPAMIFIKEARELRFDRVNQAAEELLGVSRSDLIGKNDLDMFPADQASFFEAKDRQTLERGLVVDIPEEPIETKRGRRWLHTRKVPLFDENGKARHLLGISEDITERKRVEAALIEAKERGDALNRELEAFSYSVAHDLRAPLRSIDGFSRAFLEDHGDVLDDAGRADLNRVMAAAGRMGALIDGLLELARLSRADMRVEDVDVSAVAAEAVASLRQSDPRQDVCVKIQPALCTRGDAVLLRVALDNLLGNAFKFTKGRERATIEVGMKVDAGEKVYFVRDDGVGFDPQYANKLFGAFQRLHSAREFPGTGIGLATVQRVVRRHGGRIWAHGTPDAGAVFSFTLGHSADAAEAS